MLFWVFAGASLAGEAVGPRFVSTLHEQGLVLEPAEDEWVQIHKGTVPHPKRPIVGTHPMATLEVNLSNIDGVSVGSAWWVADQGQRCTVRGFVLVEMDAYVHHRPASPCGEPLVLARLDCDVPLSETGQPTLAVPAQRGAPIVGQAHPPKEISTHDALYSRIQTNPYHAAQIAQNRDRMYMAPTAASWTLGAQTVQEVREGSLSFPLGTLLVDGEVLSVYEGNTTAVFDLDQDGRPELLGWGGQVSGAAEDLNAWQLRSADGAVLMSAAIDWCEGG